jgi:predicted nucleotidyltransferase
MKPSTAFEQNRDAIKAVIARYPVRNPRLFGSVAKGTDQEGSDLDILVDALPGTTLFHMSGIQFDLEDLLGIPVEVHTPLEISPRYRDQVLAEALPI